MASCKCCAIVAIVLIIGLGIAGFFFQDLIEKQSYYPIPPEVTVEPHVINQEEFTTAEPEEVSIEPSQYTGEAGGEIKLYCNSNPRGEVTWSKAGSVSLPSNVYISGEELRIQNTTVDDSGRYICSVRFPSSVQRQANVNVTIFPRSNEQAPKIKPLEQRYTVKQGTDIELICNTTGLPYPTVTWSMSRGQLGSNARQTGNILRILNIHPENSGVYVCLATNNAGTDQTATVVDVEPLDKSKDCDQNFEFPCNDGSCLNIILKCNKYEDCPDGEDEEDCDHLEPTECIENEFKCDDKCIPNEYRCDGVLDCVDGTDEQDCPIQNEDTTCPTNEFRCDNGQCINNDFICDGHVDCIDGSDESDQSCDEND